MYCVLYLACPLREVLLYSYIVHDDFKVYYT